MWKGEKNCDNIKCEFCPGTNGPRNTCLRGNKDLCVAEGAQKQVPVRFRGITRKTKQKQKQTKSACKILDSKTSPLPYVLHCSCSHRRTLSVCTETTANAQEGSCVLIPRRKESAHMAPVDTSSAKRKSIKILTQTAQPPPLLLTSLRRQRSR